MEDDLGKVLAYDPIADAEERMGRSCGEDDSVTRLGMKLMLEQRGVTDALLFLNRDTNAMRQTIPEFFGVLEDMGFREVLKLAIDGTPDHFHVFWKAGLLVKLDTYMGRSINSGNCYFNYCGPRTALDGSSSLILDTDPRLVWGGNISILEGMRHKLDTMSKAGELLERWIQPPFLWLLHYMDVKLEGYDHKAITAERIAMLPEHVRTAIAGVKENRRN